MMVLDIMREHRILADRVNGDGASQDLVQEHLPVQAHMPEALGVVPGAVLRVVSAQGTEIAVTELIQAILWMISIKYTS